MQTPSSRFLVLAVVFVVGAALYGVIGETNSVAAPRWPEAEEVYGGVPGWRPGPLKVDHSSNNTDVLTRTYQGTGGASATLTLITNRAPKLYGPGAEVPFLGGGFTVQSAPPGLTLPADSGISTMLAQQGNQSWLVAYAYGERRGLLGNGVWAWSLALSDGVLGRPNDYYKLYLAARTDGAVLGVSSDVLRMAQALFPKIAGWYAAAG
jgi:hypothetical protein